MWLLGEILGEVVEEHHLTEKMTFGLRPERSMGADQTPSGGRALEVKEGLRLELAWCAGGLVRRPLWPEQSQ